MLVALSDTHGDRDPRLAGRARAAVESADRVVHAGDFTTTAVLDAFAAESAALVAVHGNADDAAVCERLPASATLEIGGVRVFLVHGHEHAEVGLAMAAREAGAALAISGHTHRPTVVDAGDVVLLNPGSHAAPRGGPATHAELTPVDGGLRGQVVDRAGRTVERFAVPGDDGPLQST